MTRVRVVIQSRLRSSRLPAKALLPLAGYPAVVLCALRACNTGLEVVVATGEGAANDPLVQTLAAHQITYCRGPEEDVLARFIQATSDLEADSWVVRLTADNLFPDGQFVEALMAAFSRRQVDYLDTYSPLDGLPYGLSAEIFRIEALREANEQATTASDREHVTSWIREHRASALLRGREDLHFPDTSHLRCTLDTFDDYLRLQRVFAGVSDPVCIPWSDLVGRLAKLTGEPQARVPYKLVDGEAQGTLALGTAQLGMPYGAANLKGQPSIIESEAIVQEAIAHGVTYIDTARAYGESESRLGRILHGGWRERVNLITKLDPMPFLDDSGDAPSQAMLACAVDASLFRSLRELRTPWIDVLLLHRWSHRYRFEEAIWQRLLALRDHGVIGRLGASLYEPEEAVAALKDQEIRFLQIPFNILDWRWRSPAFQEALQSRPDVVIHGRSALLQGLLAAPPALWPKIPGVDPTDWVERLDGLVASFGRRNRTDLCFAYVRSQPWINSVVVGVETRAQLSDNLSLFQAPVLTLDECRHLEKTLAGAPEALLHPGYWPEARR